MKKSDARDLARPLGVIIFLFLWLVSMMLFDKGFLVFGFLVLLFPALVALGVVCLFFYCLYYAIWGKE